MNTIQKIAGLASILLALFYVSGFVFFGAFWDFPSSANATEKMRYLGDNQLSLSSIMFLIYVAFGCMLSILVVGLNRLLEASDNPFLSIGTLFGAIWVGLVIASGMLSNISLAYVVEVSATDPQKALDTWVIFTVIVESIGGGNELAGGVWVLIVSIVGLQQGVLLKALNYWGMFVGVAGIATIYPDDIFTEIFGIGQIVWFVWLGLNLLSKKYVAPTKEHQTPVKSVSSHTSQG